MRGDREDGTSLREVVGPGESTANGHHSQTPELTFSVPPSGEIHLTEPRNHEAKPQQPFNLSLTYPARGNDLLLKHLDSVPDLPLKYESPRRRSAPPASLNVGDFGNPTEATLWPRSPTAKLTNQTEILACVRATAQPVTREHATIQQTSVSAKVEAWANGPVVDVVYQAYKRYGYGGLPEPLEEGIISLPRLPGGHFPRITTSTCAL